MNTGQMTPKLRVVSVDQRAIGPDTAAAMLDVRYRHQRKVSDMQVQRIAASILAYGWYEARDEVCLGRVCGQQDYVVIDGQHRLWAIIETGGTYMVQVKLLEFESEFDMARYYSVKTQTSALPESRRHEGLGVATFTTKGANAYPACLAQAAKWAVHLACGEETGTRRRTVGYLPERLHEFQSVAVDAANQMGEVSRRGPLAKLLFYRVGIYGVALITTRTNWEQAIPFWTSFAQDTAEPGTPARALIRYCTTTMKTERGESARHARVAALAWEHHLEGNDVRILRPRDTPHLQIARTAYDGVRSDWEQLWLNPSEQEATR